MDGEYSSVVQHLLGKHEVPSSVPDIKIKAEDEEERIDN